MSKRDYYEVLGLGRDAGEKDVKKAYKRLAMKYHPDRTKGDKASEEKFKEVKEAYFADPLVYNEGTRARTGAEMLQGIKKTTLLFSKLTIPLLAMHGSADGLTMPDGTIRFHNEASSNDKTLKIYDGLYHELINEPEKAMVINDILTWILKRA